MNKKILIIDDDELHRAVVKRFLIKAGYENIITAETGEEGLNKARSENPDLIILDIMLPKIDGYRVCRMLKFDKNYQETPVILCSSRNQDIDKELGKEVGADHYFTKDFDQAEFIAKVNEFLTKESK